MNKWIIVIVAIVLAVCVADALAQFGGPRGTPGPYEKYEAGSLTFSAGDSLIIPADTHWRATYIYVTSAGDFADSLTIRLLKREPYTTGAVASTDEQYVLSATASRIPLEFYAVADTVILRGEKADAVEWEYFVGFTNYGPSRLVGSAP